METTNIKKFENIVNEKHVRIKNIIIKLVKNSKDYTH